jgi:hypothetical protein
MSPSPSIQTESPAVRSFLRSLNILLKSARIYGMEHAQTTSQSSNAWKHLQAALADRKKTGLRLAVSQAQLLIDGVPVKGGPAEQGFAQMLTAADLSSITFTPQATIEAFIQMVRVFAESASKPKDIARNLKETLGGDTKSGIRINEVRFVEADSERLESKVAAELVARTLGSDLGQVQGLLNDPHKLLQAITALEGTEGGTGSAGSKGSEPDRGSAASTAASTAPEEEETAAAVIRTLTKIGRESVGESAAEPAKLRQEFSRLSPSSQMTLRQVLAEFAESMPKQDTEVPLLLQIAEQLAVRVAIKRYERGDTRVDAVTETLNRMSREIDALRETLGSHEKLKEADLEQTRPSDALEQQFWDKMPESANLDVLLSDQAWQIPPRHIREYLEHVVERNEMEKLQQVLLNYVSCIQNPSPEARRRTAIGLKELVEYYPRHAGEPLRFAIRHVGEQLVEESDHELQQLISGTFVLLGQEAAEHHRYAATLEVMATLHSVAQAHPELVPSLRTRIGLGNHIPDFLEEALRVPEMPAELKELLHSMPIVAAEHLAERMSRCTRRRERDRLVRLAEELGPVAANVLSEALRSAAPVAAVNAVGLLSRLDPAALEELLLVRLREWTRVYHDAVVRQIASAGSPGRGRLLAKLLDALEPLVAPLALDEIGMSGDARLAPLLLEIAGGEVPKWSALFPRLKAIEALGRLRAKEAISLLRQLTESKAFRGTISPKELRIVAGQSLQKIDREGAKSVLSGAGFKQADLEPLPFDSTTVEPGVRQRFYPRVRFPRGLAVTISTSEGEFSGSVRELSLGGGVCSCVHRVPSGTSGKIRIKAGMRGVEAKIIMRDARSELVAFEIVDMNLEERTRLRTLLQSGRQ